MTAVRVDYKSADELLSKVEFWSRNRLMRKALTAAGRPVITAAKRKVPPPGYPGDKPGLKPLRNTIGSRFVEYPGGTYLLLVGPRYPAGAHGHLVEQGHAIVTSKGGAPTGDVPPVPFLEPAADETKTKQQAAFIKTLTREVEQELKALPNFPAPVRA